MEKAEVTAEQTDEYQSDHDAAASETVQAGAAAYDVSSSAMRTRSGSSSGKGMKVAAVAGGVLAAAAVGGLALYGVSRMRRKPVTGAAPLGEAPGGMAPVPMDSAAQSSQFKVEERADALNETAPLQVAAPPQMQQMRASMKQREASKKGQKSMRGQSMRASRAQHAVHTPAKPEEEFNAQEFEAIEFAAQERPDLEALDATQLPQACIEVNKTFLPLLSGKLAPIWRDPDTTLGMLSYRAKKRFHTADQYARALEDKVKLLGEQPTVDDFRDVATMAWKVINAVESIDEKDPLNMEWCLKNGGYSPDQAEKARGREPGWRAKLVRMKYATRKSKAWGFVSFKKKRRAMGEKKGIKKRDDPQITLRKQIKEAQMVYKNLAAFEVVKLGAKQEWTSKMASAQRAAHWVVEPFKNAAYVGAISDAAAKIQANLTKDDPIDKGDKRAKKRAQAVRNAGKKELEEEASGRIGKALNDVKRQVNRQQEASRQKTAAKGTREVGTAAEAQRNAVTMYEKDKVDRPTLNVAPEIALARDSAVDVCLTNLTVKPAEWVSWSASEPEGRQLLDAWARQNGQIAAVNAVTDQDLLRDMTFMAQSHSYMEVLTPELAANLWRWMSRPGTTIAEMGTEVWQSRGAPDQRAVAEQLHRETRDLVRHRVRVELHGEVARGIERASSHAVHTAKERLKQAKSATPTGSGMAVVYQAVRLWTRGALALGLTPDQIKKEVGTAIERGLTRAKKHEFTPPATETFRTLASMALGDGAVLYCAHVTDKPTVDATLEAFGADAAIAVSKRSPGGVIAAKVNKGRFMDSLKQYGATHQGRLPLQVSPSHPKGIRLGKKLAQSVETLQVIDPLVPTPLKPEHICEVSRYSVVSVLGKEPTLPAVGKVKDAFDAMDANARGVMNQWREQAKSTWPPPAEGVKGRQKWPGDDWADGELKDTAARLANVYLWMRASSPSECVKLYRWAVRPGSPLRHKSDASLIKEFPTEGRLLARARRSVRLRALQTLGLHYADKAFEFISSGFSKVTPAMVLEALRDMEHDRLMLGVTEKAFAIYAQDLRDVCEAHRGNAVKQQSMAELGALWGKVRWAHSEPSTRVVCEVLGEQHRTKKRLTDAIQAPVLRDSLLEFLDDYSQAVDKTHLFRKPELNDWDEPLQCKSEKKYEDVTNDTHGRNRSNYNQVRAWLLERKNRGNKLDDLAPDDPRKDPMRYQPNPDRPGVIEYITPDKTPFIRDSQGIMPTYDKLGEPVYVDANNKRVRYVFYGGVNADEKDLNNWKPERYDPLEADEISGPVREEPEDTPQEEAEPQ